MGSSDIGAKRFLIPEEVTADLAAQGYVASAPDVLAKGIGTEIALTVCNAACDTVTLLQAPGVIRALAESLIRWFRRAKPQHPFELIANGPNGHIEFKSDTAPDPETLARFLAENIWGDPPDGAGG